MVAPRVAFAGQSIPAYAKTLGRDVHVKIYPRPRNLSESREVLRVLQQYGEVIMYKHLKHDPNLHAVNTAIAIYRNANSAQSIIDASPLRFESGRAELSSSVSQFAPSTSPSDEGEEASGPQDGSDYNQEEFNDVNTARQRPNEASDNGATFTGLGGAARWGLMRSSTSTDEAATSPSPSQPPKTFTPNPMPLRASSADLPNPLPSSLPTSTSSSLSPPREFHLVIGRSVLNHHLYIRRQHYYGGFPLDLRGAMGDDLQARVPVAGLADCQFGKPEVPLRIRMKRLQEENRRGWMSLGSLWKEGEREREGEREGEKEREKVRELEERKRARERETDENVSADDGFRELGLLS